MGPCGSSWLLLALPGPPDSFLLAPPGSSWLLVAPLGSSLVPPNSSRAPLATLNPLGPCESCWVFLDPAGSCRHFYVQKETGQAHVFVDRAAASVQNSEKTRIERTATSRPDTNAPKRQRGPRKHRISSRFRLDIFVLFLFFIPFAFHEPAKPSPMYYHDSPPRCGREQCITQATKPRDFASTTSKHLKAISRYKTSPMTRHDFMDTITVLLTLCAPGRNVAVCSLRVFALFCTETKPLFSKTSCFLALSPGLPTVLHVFFAVFVYQKRHNPSACTAAIYSVGVVPNRGSTWGKASADFDMQKQRKKHAKP